MLSLIKTHRPFDVFGNLFDYEFPKTTLTNLGSYPSVDIIKDLDENKKHVGYKVAIDASGIKKENLSVSIIPGNHRTFPKLHIEVTENNTTENEGNVYYLKEITSKQISRDIILPDNVHYENISPMTWENNYLTFKIPIQEKQAIPEKITLQLPE